MRPSGEEHITFHDQTDAQLNLPDQEKLRKWLLTTAETEGKPISRLHYTFVSDEELLGINQKYLEHDTYTDIITFPYSYDPIESEIFISLERVKDNAKALDTTPEQELLRVLVHGLLHMCGYHDTSDEEKRAMRQREEYHLASWS